MIQYAVLAKKYGPKALVVVKAAKDAIQRWRGMPPEQRAKAAKQAGAVVRALGDLGRSLQPGRIEEMKQPQSYEEALTAATTASTRVDLANRILDLLRDQGPNSVEWLAGSLSTSVEDKTFDAALELARDQGFTRKTGPLWQRSWEVTEHADEILSEADHVKAIEEGIVDLLSRAGLALDDDIANNCGVEPDSPEFMGALERVIASGKAQWYDGSLFGLPEEQLEGFEPKDDLFTGREVVQLTPKSALKDLSTTTSALVKAMAVEEGAPTVASAEDDAPGDQADRLIKLKRLLDSGAITTEEYDAKKAEVLASI